MDTTPITFAQLAQRLDTRAKAASAAPATTKSAADVPAAPEKDPQDKGTASVPVDPNANPAKQNTPASASNANATPTLSAPAPGKTVTGEETPSLSGKVAKVAAGIAATLSGLRGTAPAKAAADAAAPATQVAANLPPNDKKNTDEPAGKEAAPAAAAAPKDPAAAPAPAATADPAGALPKDKPENTDSKKAGADVEIDPALYAKFASELATSEEGQAVMRKIAEAKFGAAIADDLIKAACFMAEQERALEEADAAGAFEAQELFKQASQKDQAAIIKLATVHNAGIAACENELEQHFYLEGAKAAAAMMEDPAMMGPEMPPGYNPEAVQDTDIVAVLDQLVQAGKITPEEAAQVLELIQGGGAGAEGGAPAGGPPQGGEPDGDEGAPPEEKEARSILKQAAAIAAGAAPAPATPAAAPATPDAPAAK